MSSSRNPKNVGVTPLMLPIVKLARRLGINEMVPRRISSQVHYLTSIIGPKPKIDPATRRWLVEHYRPHVRELEELLEREFFFDTEYSFTPPRTREQTRFRKMYYVNAS